MRLPIHFYYDRLRNPERNFVDEVFRAAFRIVSTYDGVRLVGDDKTERAVDALSRAVIESRLK